MTHDTPNRRQLLKGGASIGLAAALPASAVPARRQAAPTWPARPLAPPAQGPVPVAVVIGKGAVVIDFTGPWEVFEDASVPGREPAFALYTVADTLEPVRASGGLRIVPDHTFDTAPAPRVVVVPAIDQASPAMLAWLKARADDADLVMSVCAGAFVLAQAGLLAGKSATTHHASLRQLAMSHPGIAVKRGARFVEDGKVASSAGLSAGIDLALRVVERYYGRDTAERTAYNMEYLSDGWQRVDANAAYAQPPKPRPGHALCPVCEMEVDKARAPRSLFGGRAFYFCMPEHQAEFDAQPRRFAG